MSLNSDNGSGVRRTSSMRSAQKGLRPGFGSGVPRKASTPGGRERTDSTSSTDRTPFSARTNNSSRPSSRNTSISGPSGIPTPLKTRQPSNSSIPVPTNNRTRTPSGSGPRGSLQRTGSNIGQRTTAYSADGSKFGSSSALRDAVSSTRNSQM